MICPNVEKFFRNNGQFSSVGDATASLCPVAYLGYGRHGTCHGRHFDGGAKIAW